MKRSFKALATMAAMLTFLGDDCSGDLVEDSSFRLWTSDTTLAAWDVTAGAIHKAPTWSDADVGVEFVDTPTEIAQTLSGGSECAQVKIMGYVEDTADLQVFTSNSSSFNVPRLDWAEFVDYISLPTRYSADSGYSLGTTIHIRKKGSGKVVLSKIEVRGSVGCGPSTYGQ